jgi:hypothetical protein
MPRGIAKLTGMKAGSVRVLLRKMFASGEVTQPRVGYYTASGVCRRDTERPAQPFRRPDPPVLRNETELHVDSFAK